MRDFKFFQKEVKGTLDTIDGQTHTTASHHPLNVLFNADGPDSHIYRRHLYHTNRALYDRLNNPTNNNEMERYYYDHGLERFETVRPTLNQEEVVRRINGGSRETIVNPKWWMKIKMFFQTISLYWDQIWGVAVFAAMATISVILIISKILNVW